MTRAVVLRCAAEEAELLGDLLIGLGASAVLERPVGSGEVELESDVSADALEELRRRGLRPVVVARDDSWRDAWRDHAALWRSGRVVVCPPWVPAVLAAGEIELVIDPGEAFGSGSHPSTRGCLELLQRHLPGPDPSWEALDVGCGSGVLGLAALLLGADRARGIDIDPAALEATRHNAEANGLLARVEVDGAPLRSVSGRFDVVLANLLIPDIELLGKDLVAHVAPGGLLVLGGLLEGHRSRALRAVGPAEVLGERCEEGWVTLAVRPAPVSPAKRP